MEPSRVQLLGLTDAINAACKYITPESSSALLWPCRPMRVIFLVAHTGGIGVFYRKSQHITPELCKNTLQNPFPQVWSSVYPVAPYLLIDQEYLERPSRHLSLG